MSSTAPVPVDLRRVGEGWALHVDGRPFLAVGGELHNSTSSDPAYFGEQVERLARNGLNTAIASVSWAEVEPVEGELDLSVVTALVERARAAGVHLVLIWFGAFKNASSTYAPSWVRADPERFPRAVLGPDPVRTAFSYAGETPKPVLSAFSPALVEADRAACTALARHLARHDHDGTVVMLQVENEVGLLGSSRDHGADAQRAWTSPVPEEVRALTSGGGIGGPLPSAVATALADAAPGATWAELFDGATGGDADDADEVFMACGFARYVEALAAAATAAFDRPVFANAWLGPQPGQDRPGSYPSGGPTARTIGVWRAVAPTLSFVAPDVYVPGSAAVMAQYAVPGNPLFVPESRFRTGDLFLAVGAHGALGHSVFGVEDGRDGAQYFRAARGLLALTDVVVAARATDDVFGFVLEPGTEEVTRTLGDLTVTVRDGGALFRRMLLDVGVQLPEPPPPPSETVEGAVPEPGDARPHGLVVRTGPDTLLVLGQGLIVDVVGADGEVVEVDTVRELHLTARGWVPRRWLNGDERLRIVPAEALGAAEVVLLRRPAGGR